MLALFLDIFYCRVYLLLNRIKASTYVYTNKKTGNKSLDVYFSEGRDKPAPVIVFLHGGAWKLGSEKNLQSGILKQLKRGYTIVGVSYSLSQEAHWPQQLYEVKAAIRWLRANAKALNINPNCILIWGISAGGHIGNVVGTSNGNLNVEGDLGHPRQSSRVQGVISWYAPSDFLRLGKMSPLAERGFYRVTKKLLGAKNENYADKARLANPVHYISSATPPFFIQHGSWDRIVHINQSELLYTALQQAGVSAQYQLLEGYVHADLRFNSARNIERVEAFLDEISNANS